ncbi:hypothetical protein R1sor_000725 [Riccia sorocarpa]|uniref:Glycosyltransferase 2-like domain-containing protein n=1 Tax=Riccia sorocarpa TaxID=122646 RepID=A0ABD3GUS3_9MARC
MRSEEGSTIQTVAETLFRLIHELRRDRDARFQVFVGYDEDDQLLAETRAQKAITENIAYLLNTSVASSTYDPSRQFPQTDELQAAELVKWERLPSPDSPGRGFAACVAWDHLARLAFAEGCDLSLLLGDDICIIRPTNWSQQIAGKFKEAHLENGAPFGAAMVGVLEESAPGWPCFLAIHRWHVETFGELFPVRGPNAFFNQDADPFLWEVYRRFGLSRWTDEVILNNTKGGVRGGLQKIASPTRYEPVHIEWRTGLLQRYQEKLQASLPRGKEMERVTMDIAVPSFRVEPVYLRRILQLRSSFPEKLQIRFVLIIDRPLEELPKTTVAELRQMERQQRDVRIRVNSRNMGAPASRTRALRDCHSKWILFLDDDVLPDEAILDEYLEGILSAEEKPKKVSGFVGVTELDYLPQQSVMAVHLAQSTFFWRISELCASENLPVPWGVTANLLLRWDPQLSFDEQFPKTGGGEDIDICIRAGGAEGKLLAAPRARVRHPWWDDGKRLNLWRRLFLWAQGDGMLQSKYPEYTYRSFPNIWEHLNPVLRETLQSWAILSAILEEDKY